MSVNAFLREPVVEVLHGRAVVDPYRWLEDRDSSATSEWIAQQQRHHDDYFSRVPEVGQLRARVSRLLNKEVFDQPVRIGDSCFYRRRKKDQEQAYICMRSAATDAERVLVDPSEQGPFVAVQIHRVRCDGSMLAYTVQHGGSDKKAIHIVDVERGHTLADHLETGYSRGFAFAYDGSGFYYCHEESLSLESHTIRFHRFGGICEEDRVLFRLERRNQSKLALIADESCIGAFFTYSDGADRLADFYLSRDPQSAQWVPVFTARKGSYGVILRINSIFAVTDEGGTKRRVVELTDDGRIIRVVVPEWEHEIHSFIIAGGHAFVSYQRDGRSIVRQWILRGNHVRTIDIPEYSSIELLSDLGANSNSLFYTIESFAKSPAIWEYRLATDDHSPWCAPSISAEDDTLRIERVSCRSTDGIEIPILLAMSSNLKMGQAHPLILTGYGGFGVPMTPKFSVLIRIMLDLGAVFALANIRGGSEFGKPWHDAARARNRQVAFDDFIAAAEWLCATGITTPRVLAIFGGSNSGLLVGAAMTQRPDLFRAVLCIAPLLDMVRYEQFDFAKRWRHEYGSVEDPEEFAALVGYSPYHHVREDVSYPSTFFVTGDQDDRCNPAHVRKMAALLESRSAQSNPILVDYCQHRGHSPVLPVSLRIEALTRRIGFLCHELGIEIRSEAIHDSAPL